MQIKEIATDATWTAMTSRDLRPSEENKAASGSEVQFALVIARMLETVKNHPEHLRQVVYDLARYKLQEQFTHADVKEMRRSQQALETAIRSVEEFSQQLVDLPPPAPPALAASDQAGPLHHVAVRELPPTSPRARIEIDRSSTEAHHPLWPVIKRTTALLTVAGLAVLVVQQRQQLASLAHYFQHQVQERQIAAAPPQQVPAAAVQPPVAPPKPNPLRPTDYGVYAVVDDKSLAELQLLPGRAPDVRVAVSAAFKAPDQAGLPNGHPKFIVFRRDAVTNILERAEVRVIAKITREFSAETSGKKPEADDAWVIRNASYPFRASPVADTPEMYELHSEDPALELPPGRYALILKAQSYYFSVNGNITDPRQCIERIVTANGTFYTDCKKP
ncbi:hypothetical protein [Bradyrhizobium sp. B117]|uniref:hypothetical protein n=1 Tax=Bradyrhizobium sp. B117 TaxID=3140246 RepID=UPI003183A196